MPGSEPASIEADRGFERLGSNQSGMRARNERLVLSLVRKHGALPKAELARMTSLSAQTVSVIMRSLEKDGLLERGAKLRGKVGQPSIPMRLAPNGALFFGFKVGRRSAELILVNFLGEIQARAQQTYRYPSPKRTLDFLRSAISKITADLGLDMRSRISGLGIATPFFLWEWAAAIGVDESEMAAWKDFDLAAEIQELVDFPVILENDATCACGAELVFGKGAAPSDFLYLYIGYFIGGGIVLNGNLFTGPSGNAGAIGPLPTDGSVTRSRQLVDVASLAGLEKRLLAEGGKVSQIWASPDAWDIPQRIVESWLDEAVPAIAHAILSSISVIDFTAILIDGSMPVDLRSELVARVDRRLSELNLSGLGKPEILPGSVGANARSIGAASLPLSKRFMLEF
ncbi:MAG: ROK family transcriptional regulator [Pseudomonadota bacterium]